MPTLPFQPIWRAPAPSTLVGRGTSPTSVPSDRKTRRPRRSNVRSFVQSRARVSPAPSPFGEKARCEAALADVPMLAGPALPNPRCSEGRLDAGRVRRLGRGDPAAARRDPRGTRDRRDRAPLGQRADDLVPGVAVDRQRAGQDRDEVAARVLADGRSGDAGRRADRQGIDRDDSEAAGRQGRRDAAPRSRSR